MVAVALVDMAIVWCVCVDIMHHHESINGKMVGLDVHAMSFWNGRDRSVEKSLEILKSRKRCAMDVKWGH